MTPLRQTLLTEKNVFPPTCDNKKTIHFETLGCRLNQIETEGAAEFFYQQNWTVQMTSLSAKDAEDSSVCLCVLNTCAVTGKAEQKDRRTIKLLLKKFPQAALIVTGCYAELSPKEIEAMDSRIVLLPGSAKSALSKVPEYLNDLFKDGVVYGQGLAFSLREFFSGDKKPFLEGIEPLAKKKDGLFLMPVKAAADPFALLPKSFFAHSRASIKVQDGCNNSCSFCAIHFARGKSVSIEAKVALERVQDLEKSGQSELVLTGVNIGQYRGEWQGKDLDISGLLELILAGTKKIAIRFSSIYPECVTEKFAEVIKNERVRPHFHISVQSGSDKILRRMNRPYSRQKVLEACRRLKAAKENPFLACDIITGFPGESEEDFEESLSLLKEGGFSNAHAFPYSPRPGTAAASLLPKIPERVKDERVKALNDYSALAKTAYINSFAGSVRPAVAESVRGKAFVPQGKKLVRAVTDNFIHAEILLDEGEQSPLNGQNVFVKILGANEDAIKKGMEWEAYAELCKNV